MLKKNNTTFTDKLIEKIKEKNSILCVGLDPQLKFIPEHIINQSKTDYGQTFKAIGHAFLDFNEGIISAIAPYAVAVKPNNAFYECYGHWGIWALEKTISYAHSKNLLVITDVKKGDGGDSSEAYAQGYLGTVDLFNNLSYSPLKSDAVTIQAYIGSACVNPFIEKIKKHRTGVFVVNKTSFKPNSEIEQIETISGKKLWQVLALMIKKWGTGTEGKYGYRNLGVVMGATYPKEAEIMRKILPNSWFLVPGYGAQGGGAKSAVIGANYDGLGIIVNSSRGIIAAWQDDKYRVNEFDFPEAARTAAIQANEDLNSALKKADKFNW